MFMESQILFSGVTPTQLSEIIVNGVKEELGKLLKQNIKEEKPVEDEYLTIKEACRFLKCSETKLWRIRKAGKLKSTDNGRSKLIKKSDIEQYLNESNNTCL